MTVNLARTISTLVALAALGGGCNMILGNDEGVAAKSGASGASGSGGGRVEAGADGLADISVDASDGDDGGSVPTDVSDEGNADTRDARLDLSTDLASHDQEASVPIDGPMSDISIDAGNDSITAHDTRDGDDASEAAPTCTNCPSPTSHGSAVCEAGVCGVVCEPNWTPCGTDCVNVVSDTTNCGRCSHSCGNGLCAQGICQPTTIIANIDAPNSLAVDPGGVYFPIADRILNCPLNGCVQAPRQLASNLSGLGRIAVANATIVYIAYLDVNACPTSGCDASSPTLWIGAGAGNKAGLLLASGLDIYAGFFGEGGQADYRRCVAPAPACAAAIKIAGGVLRPPVVVDDGKIFMTNAKTGSDAGNALVSCDVGQPCGDNITPVAWGWELAETDLLAAAGGSLYFQDRDDNGLRISVCSEVTGCNPRTSFAHVPAILELIADASGVHWIQGTAQSASIATCPLSGCVGGPQIVARDQLLAAYLQSDGQFLYWVNRGAPIDGGTDPAPGTAAIMRVAR